MNRNTVLQRLDAAVDRMDLGDIDRELENLESVSPCPLQAEDPALFAARVQQLHKERNSMKKTRKSIIAAVAVVAAMTLGATVYAASTYNIFSFAGDGDRFVTVRTTDTMTEEEARQHVAVDESTDMDGVPAVSPDVAQSTYQSVADAALDLDMVIPVPAVASAMELESVQGQRIAYGGDYTVNTVWADYGDGQGRLFGITVTRSVIREGADVMAYTVSDMDEGSLSAYTNTGGVEFTLLTESDDTGASTAHIAVAQVGEYEYTLVFLGFEEAQRQEVLDSVDLTQYR